MSLVADDEAEQLVDHLVRTTRLPRAEAGRVVAEVLAFYDESAEAFVQRRHAELRRQRMQNAAIFTQVKRELELRRFVAPDWSERQLRRLIYG